MNLQVAELLRSAFVDFAFASGQQLRACCLSKAQATDEASPIEATCAATGTYFPRSEVIYQYCASASAALDSTSSPEASYLAEAYSVVFGLAWIMLGSALRKCCLLVRFEAAYPRATGLVSACSSLQQQPPALSLRQQRPC